MSPASGPGRTVSPVFRLRPATEADFEALLALSIEVMRGHLERLGRFDPARRRARMRAAFNPRTTWVAEDGAGLLGCIACTRHPDHLEVHSFYLAPRAQGRSLGGAILAEVLAGAPHLPVRIEVLKESPALRFWQRQGFQVTGEQPFDWVMERPLG